MWPGTWLPHLLCNVNNVSLLFNPKGGYAPFATGLSRVQVRISWPSQCYPIRTMAPSFVERKKIAKDTIARSASITAETAGASLESTFIPKQLPALDDLTCPGFTSTDLKVVNLDSFSAARNLLENYKDVKGKVAVLNLASDEERGGGWVYSLATTQVRSRQTQSTNCVLHPHNYRKKLCATPQPCTKLLRHPTIPGQT